MDEKLIFAQALSFVCKIKGSAPCKKSCSCLLTIKKNTLILQLKDIQYLQKYLQKVRIWTLFGWLVHQINYLKKKLILKQNFQIELD